MFGFSNRTSLLATLRLPLVFFKDGVFAFNRSNDLFNFLDGSVNFVFGVGGNLYFFQVFWFLFALWTRNVDVNVTNAVEMRDSGTSTSYDQAYHLYLYMMCFEHPLLSRKLLLNILHELHLTLCSSQYLVLLFFSYSMQRFWSVAKIETILDCVEQLLNVILGHQVLLFCSLDEHSSHWDAVEVNVGVVVAKSL